MLLRYPETALVSGPIRVRPWRETDLACIEAAASDPAILDGTTVPCIFTREQGLAFVRRQWTRLHNGEGISQAITDATSDEALGLIYLAQRGQPWIAGLGYWLVPTARGQHKASPAIDVVSHWALSELRFARIEAWVAPDNLASQRALERSGFRLEGRLRNFLKVRGRLNDGLVFSRTPDTDQEEET